MAPASELLPLILASVASRKALRSARIGAERCCRASRRSAGLRPRMSASTANSRAILAPGGRARLDVHVVDLASGVAPTGDFGQAGNAGLRIGCVEISEARIAVGVQEAATAGEQRPRVLRSNGVGYVLGVAPTSTLCRRVETLEASTKARFKALPREGKVRRFKEYFDAAQSWSRVERIIARPTAAAASFGNIVLFGGRGNQCQDGGLPGGGRSHAKPVSIV